MTDFLPDLPFYMITGEKVDVCTVSGIILDQYPSNDPSGWYKQKLSDKDSLWDPKGQEPVGL